MDVLLIGPTSKVDAIVEELTYRSYSANRLQSPQISPKRWEQVYGPHTGLMEIRFRQEQGRVPLRCNVCNWINLVNEPSRKCTACGEELE